MAGEINFKNPEATSKPKAPAPGLSDLIFKAKYNQKLANYQNDYNYWMWQQQNQYNSPKSQMDRFTEAGLSKNLMYGQGDAGNAGDPKSAEGNPMEQAQGFSSVNPLAKLNMLGDYKMKMANVDYIKANTPRVTAVAKQEQEKYLGKTVNPTSVDQFDIDNMSPIGS